MEDPNHKWNKFTVIVFLEISKLLVFAMIANHETSKFILFVIIAKHNIFAPYPFTQIVMP